MIQGMEGEGCILRSTSTKEYIVIKLILKSELACHQIEQAKNNTIDFNFFSWQNIFPEN